MSIDSRPFLPPDPAALAANRLKDISALFRHLALHGDAGGEVGLAPLSNRVRLAAKAAVLGATLGNQEAIAAYDTLRREFLVSLRHASVFDRVLQFARQVPMLAKVNVVTTGFLADEVQEGRAKPVTSAGLALSDPLTPRKASAIAVVTEELARQDVTGQLLTDELRGAIVKAVDVVFLEELLASVTPGSGAGAGAANIRADLFSLLDGVDVATGSPIVLVAGQHNYKKIISEFFPNFVWASNGDVMMSDAIAADTVMVIAPYALAMNGGEISLDTSREAALEMRSDPVGSIASGSPSAPSPAQLVSLFQTNSVASRCERLFAFKPLRAGAVYALTGVTW